MTEEERNSILSLLLSDGSFQSKTYWENEENGMIAVYNGSKGETVTEVNVTVPHLRHLYGKGEAELSGESVSGWEIHDGDWGDTFFYADETYTGGGALGIRTTGNAYISQYGKDVVAGKTYTLSAWVKTMRGKGAIKIEYFDAKGDYQAGSDHLFYESTDGEWTKAEFTFTVPEGSSKVGFLLRVIGGGEVYWDNVSLSDGTSEIPIANSGFEASKNGVLTLTVPPKTLMVFGLPHRMHHVLEKNNIIYEKPIPGAVVRCSSDTWVSQYIRINGIKGMIGFYKNGDALQSGDGEISFFRWDTMLRPKE